MLALSRVAGLLARLGVLFALLAVCVVVIQGVWLSGVAVGELRAALRACGMDGECAD